MYRSPNDEETAHIYAALVMVLMIIYFVSLPVSEMASIIKSIVSHCDSRLQIRLFVTGNRHIYAHVTLKET